MVNRRIIDQAEAIQLTDRDYLVVDNVNLGTRKIQFSRLLSGATPLPPNYSTGFDFSVLTDTTFSVAGGYARSMDNERNIQLLSSLTKDISLTFALGNNAGCMPSDLTLQANTKYYIFVISNSTGLTDIIIDTNENCANGLVDDTIVLNNFDKYAMLGSFYTGAQSEIWSVSYLYDYIVEKRQVNNTTAWRKYRSGALVQFGEIETNGYTTVIFPLPFKNANYNVQLTPRNNDFANYSILGADVNTGRTNTIMQIRATQRTGSGQGNAHAYIGWYCIGLAQGGF